MMSEADSVVAPNKTTAITAAAAAMQQDAIRALLIEVLPLIEAEYLKARIERILAVRNPSVDCNVNEHHLPVIACLTEGHALRTFDLVWGPVW